MEVPTLFAQQFQKLALSTGVDAETYLTMACRDWFEVSAPTYQLRPTKVRTSNRPPPVCKISKLPVLLALVPLKKLS
jgi:hypothetical protein